MKIAGLRNLSLVDYPGQLAATLFVQGCNFRCGYCHNPELVEGQDGQLREEEVIDSVCKRNKIIEAVVITGGEPTLFEDLCDFTEKIKEKGFKVKLDTNGANPDVIERLFRKRMLDYIAMDIKTSMGKYNLVSDQENISDVIMKSLRLIMLSTVPYELRTTCVPGIVDESDIEKIGKMVKGASKYCLQQFRPFTTYDDKYKKVMPYSKETLHKFKDILQEYVREVEIRGI